MRYKWGDIISLEYGKPVKDKDSTNGTVPVYGTNGKIGTSNLPPLCNFPSVILGRKGAYRGVHYSDCPFSVIDTAFFIQPLTDELDTKWVYYKFKTYDINNMDSGSAIPSTDRYEIYAMDVVLPTLPEQKAIAAVLSALDDKIELNNRINKNLEAQAQAIFKSWFVDFEPFQDGEFVDSELGPIPKGWRVGKLAEIIDISTGKRPAFKSERLTANASVPIVGASGIMAYTNDNLLCSKIIVTGRVGTHGVVQRYNRPIWISDNAFIVKTNFYEYTYQIFKNIDYVKLNRGSTQPLITQTDLKNEITIIPSDEILNSYEKIIHSFFAIVY